MTPADPGNPSGHGRPSGRRATWFAWLGTWLLFVAVAHGSFETTDAAFTMHAARALWQRGDSALLTAEQGGELEGERLAARFIADSEARGARVNGKLGTNGRAYVWFPMGHVFLLAPFTALGEALTAVLPDADARLQRISAEFPNTWVFGHPVVVQGLISLLVPSLCMATSILLLFRIAQAFGAAGRDAACTALAIGFASQAFALGREQLSDGPGLVLVLAALLQVVRLHAAARAGSATAGHATAWWAGTWSGLAVLLRYQTAFAVAAFAVVVAIACRRRGTWRDLVAFALGGAPALAVFLLTNWLRFGNPLVTGYPEVSDWMQASPVAGLAKILFAAGRGVMWFSPLLWLALPQVVRAPRLRWLAIVLFATPLLLFMGVNGWQGGQCWAVRYVTPGIVALLAIVLPQTRPWRTWPKLWWGLVLLGVLVNLTSLLAPVRGQLQLADQAIRAGLQRDVAASVLEPAAAAAVDSADVGGFRLRYSPLWTNWRYAARSCVGGFEDAAGRRVDGSANTIEPLFGVPAVDPAQGLAPMHWTDRCARHLWWRFWGDLYGVPGWLLLLPVLLLGVPLAVVGWRGLGRSTATSDSSTAG